MINKITNIISKAIAYIFNPKIFLIIAVVLIAYYGVFTASFLGERGNPIIDSTTSKLISENSIQAVYELSFVSQPLSKTSDCFQDVIVDFDFPVEQVQSTSSLPPVADNIIYGNYDADIVTISGVKATENICSDKTRTAQVVIENTKALCNIKEGLMIEGVPRAIIKCQVSGEAHTSTMSSAKFYGLTGGSIRIIVPKEKPTTPNNPDTPTSPRGILKKFEDFMNSILFSIKSFFARIF